MLIEKRETCPWEFEGFQMLSLGFENINASLLMCISKAEKLNNLKSFCKSKWWDLKNLIKKIKICKCSWTKI